MTEQLQYRIRVLEEAQAIERAGGEWDARHVAAVLGCSRSTVYDTPWLLQISVRAGGRGRRWRPKDIRERQTHAARYAGKSLRRAG